jgi:hypothetical protein
LRNHIYDDNDYGNRTQANGNKTSRWHSFVPKRTYDLI